jgi:hypothetical protein
LPRRSAEGILRERETGVMARNNKVVRWTRRLVGVGSFLAGLMLGEGRAAASQTFPPILAEKLGMDCVPNCLPCHTEAEGTSDNQRFDGIKGELERIAAGNVGSDEIVAAALDQLLLEQPSLDSDGDGTQDIAELSAAENPYGGPALCDRPLYGCFASHVSPTLPTRLGALALSLGVASALLVRRRR